MKVNCLKVVSAALVAGVLAVPTLSSAVDARELKLAHFMPPIHHNHTRVLVPFAEELAQRTNGDLTVKIFPAGQLGPGPVEQYKRTVEGVTDIGFICQAFTPNVFPKTLLSMQIGTAKTAVEQTNRYYDAIDLIEDEYESADVKLLGVWSVAPTVVVTRDTPVRSVDDLEGLKIATGGSAFNPVIERWGAEPVSMPLGDIQNAVGSGIVDGVIISGSILAPPWNLQEVAHHVAVGVPGLMAPCGIIMNRDAWNSLSAEEQSIISELTGREMALVGARSFDAEAQAALTNARVNPDLTVVDLGDSARQRFIDMATPLARDVIEKLQEDGIPNPDAAFEALTQ